MSKAHKARRETLMQQMEGIRSLKPSPEVTLAPAAKPQTQLTWLAWTANVLTGLFIIICSVAAIIFAHEIGLF